MDTAILLDNLALLGDRSRFTILQIMARGAIRSCCNRIEAYENGCCVADVVSLTALSQPTVSHHLKALEKANLVRKECRGPWTCYFPNPSAIDALLQALYEELLPRHPLNEDAIQSGCCL